MDRQLLLSEQLTSKSEFDEDLEEKNKHFRPNRGDLDI